MKFISINVMNVLIAMMVILVLFVPSICWFIQSRIFNGVVLNTFQIKMLHDTNWM